MQIEKKIQITIRPKQKLVELIDRKKALYGTRARTVIAVLVQSLEGNIDDAK